MIRLWHKSKAYVDPVSTFDATREGPFIIIDGSARIGSDLVRLAVLCCRGSERHLYSRHVYSLHRRDDSTWCIEPGPHVIERGKGLFSVVNDAIELCGVPKTLDLFSLTEIQ